MAGLKCNGRLIKSSNGRLSGAFCEGQHYRIGGTALQRPITDNPFPAGREDECRTAWDEGWTIADNAAGGEISKGSSGCCATRGQTVPA